MNEIVQNEINIFVNNDTRDFVKLFNLDENCLQSDPSTLDDSDSYRNALSIVTELRAMNDTAERGIGLIENYNTLFTINEENIELGVCNFSDDHKSIINISELRQYLKYIKNDEEWTIKSHKQRIVGSLDSSDPFFEAEIYLKASLPLAMK
ncbi:Hypothetical protein CINCED_3A001183 [Cinara cedri]|uniref:Uncharacterized protein n=1 Tax=Cinara cedri TaxID=506608 RepID=A0A5E4N515_9HEMI|nr:Hypothetical protein CINCED_3A001183 [Cinara cedri]